MRKRSLRQLAKGYLATHNTGNHRRQRQRVQVIQRFINDLFIIRCLPEKLKYLSKTDLEKLIAYWKQKRLSESTIIKYMTDIRPFLNYAGISTSDMHNEELKLTYPKYRPSSKSDIDKLNIDQLEPLVAMLITMQIQFGLTLGEAMCFIPGIHQQDNSLWLTREITYNSLDRLIPIRTSEQVHTLDALSKGSPAQSLTDRYPKDYLITIYRQSLLEHRLSTKRHYRYLYAQWLSQYLQSRLTAYMIKITIMDEMGLKSRTSLWHYLS